jgi:uncharacterized protein YcfL
MSRNAPARMNHARRIALAMVAMTGALALAGCHDPVKAPYAGQPDYVGRANHPKVVVPGELNKYLAVDAPIVEQSDVLKVTVPIRLLSNAGQESNIQYRFLFFSASGAPARGGDMNWRFQHLYPRNSVNLVANSLDADATDWRCEIRLNK